MGICSSSSMGSAPLTLPTLAAETLLFCVGKPLAPFPRATPVTLGAVEVEEDEGRLVRMALLPLWRQKRLLLSGAAPGGGGGGMPPTTTTPDVYDSFGSGLFLRTARARLACSGKGGRGVGVGVGVAVEGRLGKGASPSSTPEQPSDKLSSVLKTWVSRGSNILRVYAKARPMDIYMADADSVENTTLGGNVGGEGASK